MGGDAHCGTGIVGMTGSELWSCWKGRCDMVSDQLQHGYDQTVNVHGTLNTYDNFMLAPKDTVMYNIRPSLDYCFELFCRALPSDPLGRISNVGGCAHAIHVARNRRGRGYGNYSQPFSYDSLTPPVIICIV